MFFKGFVKTKNKKCVEKFKNVPASELHTLEEAEQFDEYAGILDENAILVDIDDFEQSEILFKIVEEKQLNCRVYETTRGKHFLFLNDGIEKCYTHCKLACGLTADIKVGVKNSYEVLKVDGKERPIIYDIFEDESYQKLPKWMHPVKFSDDFTKMEAGDGRNQALFNYILTLQSHDFEVEEARDCIRLINKSVLSDPLGEDELEVILRDDAFSQPVFYKGTTFLFDKFSVYMKNNHHIIRINNQLHIYNNGIYVPGQQEIESAMISHLPQLNRSKRQEVMSYLDILIRENTPTTDARMICFNNGLLNIETDEFVEYTPEHIITNKIPWDYNPNAYNELTDEVLDNISCNDKDIRKLLEEVIGYCMFRRNELGKAFILTGSGSNGKSTYLNMLKTMLGKRNLSVLDLNKLDDRFSTVMMFGKLANIGDDISDEFVTNAAEFKKIVTGESIDAEQKGQPKFQFDPYVKLIFSANNIPRIGKGRDSSAIMRRLLIVPFNANFQDTDANFKPFIGDELRGQDSMEYLILLGIKALKGLLQRKTFTVSEKIQEELKEFEETNNPVLGFFHDIDGDEDAKIENEPTKNVYRLYQEYCIANSMNPMSAGEFSKQVKKYYGYVIKDKKIQGKKYRIFVKG